MQPPRSNRGGFFIYVEYDSFTGMTSDPRPMSEFPTPVDLRARYERGMGFSLDAPAARPLLQPLTARCPR